MFGVVEIGRGVAASWCGKAFADLGADVLKLEPPDGDSLRARRGAFVHLNTNKRSRLVTSGDEVSAEFAAADLIVEVRGEGDLAGLGVDAEQLRSEHPTKTIVTISGFGANGPYRDHRWSVFVAQAFAGAFLMDARGPGSAPDVDRGLHRRAHGGDGRAGLVAAGARDRDRRSGGHSGARGPRQ